MHRIQLHWANTISKQQKPSLVSTGTSNTTQQTRSLRMQSKLPNSNVPTKEKPGFGNGGRRNKQGGTNSKIGPLTVLDC